MDGDSGRGFHLFKVLPSVFRAADNSEAVDHEARRC